MIELQQTYELRGSCTGITSTLVERTAYKALYLRSDGYLECFRIKTAQYKIHDGTKWVDTGERYERYPYDEAFGDWAWCGKRNIREIYNTLKQKEDAEKSKVSREENPC